MTISTGKLEYKYRQAEFFLREIRPDNLFEASCYLSAFACAVRAVFQQAEKALRQLGEKNCWGRVIMPWINGLSSTEKEALEVLKNIRNEDIHVETVTPSIRQHHTISIIDIMSVAPPFSTKTLLLVTDPVTMSKYVVQDLCEKGLSVARKLIDSYPAL